MTPKLENGQDFARCISSCDMWQECGNVQIEEFEEAINDYIDSRVEAVLAKKQPAVKPNLDAMVQSNLDAMLKTYWTPEDVVKMAFDWYNAQPQYAAAVMPLWAQAAREMLEPKPSPEKPA